MVHPLERWFYRPFKRSDGLRRLVGQQRKVFLLQSKIGEPLLSVARIGTKT